MHFNIDVDYVANGKPSKQEWVNHDLADGFYVISSSSWDTRTTWYGPVEFEDLKRLQLEVYTVQKMGVDRVRRWLVR